MTTRISQSCAAFPKSSWSVAPPLPGPCVATWTGPGLTSDYTRRNASPLCARRITSATQIATAMATLTIADFGCFQSNFANGCQP